MTELRTKLSLDSTQFTAGLNAAAGAAQRFYVTANNTLARGAMMGKPDAELASLARSYAKAGEEAGKAFNTKLAKFTGHLGGAGKYDFMLFSGLASAIEDSGGSLAKFGKNIGSTAAVVGAVVGLNMAFEEGGKQLDGINAKLKELGYKGTGLIGMVRIAFGDLSGLEVDAAQRKLNAINRALDSVANKDSKRFRELLASEYQAGAPQDDLDRRAELLTTLVGLEKQLAAAVADRQNKEMMGAEPRTVAQLDAQIQRLQLLSEAAKTASQNPMNPVAFNEEAILRAARYQIEIERLRANRPAMAEAEAAQAAADAERKAAQAVRERVAAAQELAAMEGRLGDLREQNYFSALSEDEKRAALAERIADAEEAAAAARLLGNERGGLENEIMAEQLRGRLQSMRDQTTQARPDRPAIENADNWARIGLFAGGASAAMDYARRTAEATMTLVQLVRAGIRVNAMNVNVTATATAG
jgi:hypothetical protein